MRNLYTLTFFLLFVVVPVIQAMSIVRRSIDDDDKSEIEVERRIRYHRRSMTVHRFARHVLCRRHDFRRYFYDALVETSCLEERFLADLVVSLCTGKDGLLEKFVSELFDTDRDGYINEHEKNQYWY